MDKQVLILTLNLDSLSQLFFNKLRKQHFPAERNYLEAHLTLFHQLPSNEPLITEEINNVCNKTEVFDMDVTDIISIGSGVAYKILSSQLQQIHTQFQKCFLQWLIPQDKQSLWPHITIQNKTTPAIAHQLIQDLKIDFTPFKISAEGLNLWEYKGGPWEFISSYEFKS